MRHLSRLTAVTALAVLLLFALSAQVPAAPVDPLRAAFLATGAGRFDAVRYGGVGATFVATRGQGGVSQWTRMPFHRYDADVDLQTGVVRVHLTPAPGEGAVIEGSGGAVEGHVEPRRECASDPVPRLWLTPHGFLKAARAHGARVTPGPRETTIVFEQGRHRVYGFLNVHYQVDRVQVWALDDSARGAERQARVEVRYRDYEPMPGAGAFPRHVIEARQGRPALDLWVWAASGVPARDLRQLVRNP